MATAASTAGVQPAVSFSRQTRSSLPTASSSGSNRQGPHLPNRSYRRGLEHGASEDAASRRLFKEGKSFVPGEINSRRSRRSLLTGALPSIFRSGSPPPMHRSRQSQSAEDAALCGASHDHAEENRSFDIIGGQDGDWNLSPTKISDGGLERKHNWGVHVPGLQLESALAIFQPVVKMLPAFDWPFSGPSSTELDADVEGLLVDVYLEEELSAPLDAAELDQESRAELEALSRPRCAWPRTTVVTQSAPAAPQSSSFAPGTAQDLASANYPRCAWPRNSVSSSTTSLAAFSTHSSTSPLSQASAVSPHPLAAPPPGPRCAWPRVASPAVALESPAAGPRCAWPRKAMSAPLASSTFTAILVEEREDYLVAEETREIVPLGPHSAWPRKTIGSAASLVTPVTPQPFADKSSLLTAAEVAPPAPRCAWPRQSSKVSSPTSFIGEVADEGKIKAAPSPSVINEVSEWFVNSSLRTWDAARGGGAVATGIPFSSSTTSLPKSSNGAAAFFQPVNGIAGSEQVGAVAAPGPRCAWPRQVGTVAKALKRQSVAFIEEEREQDGESKSSEQEIVMGPRCSWPREGGRVGGVRGGGGEKSSPSLEVRAFVQSPVIGPHCAWPRAGVAALGGRGLVGHTAAGAVADVADDVAVRQLGPRCAWPRAVAPAVAASAPSTELSMGAELAPGPRCAWPRAVAPASADVALTRRSLDMTVSGLGPRCEWPRAAKGQVGSEVAAAPAAPAVVEPVVGHQQQGAAGVEQVRVAGEARRRPGGLADLLASKVNGRSEVKGGDGHRRRLDERQARELPVGAAWPRRVLGTSVCIGLLNQILLSNGGPALASPLDALDLAADPSTYDADGGLTLSYKALKGNEGGTKDPSNRAAADKAGSKPVSPLTLTTLSRL